MRLEFFDQSAKSLNHVRQDSPLHADGGRNLLLLVMFLSGKSTTFFMIQPYLDKMDPFHVQHYIGQPSTAFPVLP